MAEREVGASEKIDARIRELGGWRGETLDRGAGTSSGRRTLTSWRNGSGQRPPVRAPRCGRTTAASAPVNSYQNVIKLTFFKGADLNDPAGLFNSSLEGKVRRAIDIREGDTIDEAALSDLIRQAVGRNHARS